MFQNLRIGSRLMIAFGAVMAIFLGGIAFAVIQVINTVRAIEMSLPAAEIAQLPSLSQSLSQFLIIMTVVTLIGTGLMSIILFSLFRSFSRPLGQLFTSAKRWSEGDIVHRAAIDGENEFSQLGQVLNRVAERQQNWTQILEKTMTDHSRQLEHRTFHLETSVAIAQRITSILDRDSLLQQVTELIRQRYELTYVGLFLTSRAGNYLTLQASTRENDGGKSPKSGRVTRLPIEEHSLIGWAGYHRRPALSSNLFEEKNEDGRFESDLKSRAELALPLTIGRDLVGVLDLHSDQPAAFVREDLPMFQSLADQVAIAIKNASIYESEQSERQLSETLQRVGRELNSTLNLTEVQNLILHSTQTILPFDSAMIFLLDGPILTSGARKQARDVVVEQTIPPLNLDELPATFPLKAVVDTAQPVVVPDLTRSAEWVNLLGLPQSGSWLGVPLVQEDQVHGMLTLNRVATYAFVDQDVALAAAIGAQASIALENARLYDQIKRFSEQLEYEVRRRTLALQTAYDQLEQLDAAKTNFIGIASHELRTPLTVLKGYSQILSKAPEIIGNPQYAALIEGIISGTRRLQEIVDTMLDMARIENRSLTVLPEPISLFEIVADIRSSLEEALAERQIGLEMTPEFRRLPALHADYDGIRKVFYHLVINAIKYTPDGGEIVIDGRAWEGEPVNKSWPRKGVEITITDNGIGIQQENLEAIFNKFFQTGQIALHSSGKTKFKGGGPGLGLAIVKGIIEAHRGLVWAESDGYDEAKRPGSTFHIVLPLLQSAAHQKNQLPVDVGSNNSV